MSQPSNIQNDQNDQNDDFHIVRIADVPERPVQARGSSTRFGWPRGSVLLAGFLSP